jgi:transketolase
MRKACLQAVYELARKDSRVLFFGSDLGVGTLEQMKQEMPERFFMEGVSETNIIGMMSGLAMNGKIPYCNAIAVFLTRRCYEHIMLDAAMQNLNLRLLGNGGGLVYAPLGVSHLAFDDIAIMSAIPNMTIIAPCDADEMRRLMPLTLEHQGPIYLRFGKGGEKTVSSADKPFEIGKAILMREGNDALIVTTGITLKDCLDAAEILDAKGINAAVLHMHTVKPLDSDTLLRLASKARVVVTVEEHSIIGGLGNGVAGLLAEANMEQPALKFKRIALPDVCPNLYGSQREMMDYFGINCENIVKTVLDLLRQE